MGSPTFEYCSLYYLNQWLDYDRGFFEAMSGSDDTAKLSTLKKAAGFYRVARNLHTKKKGPERYQPVLDILDTVNPEQFKRDRNQEIVREIISIERRISSEYNNRNCLSLTTKFLWLKVREPILIYDSQARKALGSKDGNLECYYEKWPQCFKRHKQKIEEACASLHKLHRYTYSPDQKATESYINKISSQIWFQKRVFDIYLWLKGNGS